MTPQEAREIYGPFWEGRKQKVSDAALKLTLQLSRESISGFEGADIIGLAPIISETLAEAKRDTWEQAARICEAQAGGHYMAKCCAAALRSQAEGENKNPG